MHPLDDPSRDDRVLRLVMNCNFSYREIMFMSVVEFENNYLRVLRIQQEDCERMESERRNK